MTEQDFNGEFLPDKLTARELVDSVLTGVVRTGYDGPDGISKDEALERSCVLASRVEAALALHAPKADPEFGQVCSECDKESDYGVAWPCPTRRALEGKP